MSRNWTLQQKNAIYATDGSVLVSAAAGSGKTAVLVERVIKLITREKNPLDVDRLLIVTFTRAAAAEMRERIQAAVNKLLEDDPYNAHLLAQRQLLYSANISTIDSFCGDIVREYFHTLDVARDFRIADEGELEILRQEALDNTFESFYDSEDDCFYSLLDLFKGKQGDQKLRETVLKISEFLTTQPFPDKWLDDMLENYSETDIEKTVWGKIIIDYAQSAVFHGINLTENSILRLKDDEKLRDAVEPLLVGDSAYFTLVQLKFVSSSWDEIRQAIFSFETGRMKSPKGYKDNPIKISVSSNRDEVKETVKKLQSLFFWSEEDARLELSQLHRFISTLFTLVRAYDKKLSELKAKKNILSFADIESLTVKLLAKPDDENGYTKTVQAQEISNRFDAVMVDEFQDVNDVQDLIFKSVSNDESNLFVVGDVKQSIYVDPKKYDAHSNITDVTKDGVLQYHYGYDMMNQLVSVDDKLNGKVYKYTYDAGGNLISETVTDSNGTTSNAYEYNNSNWGDVLTSYNGQSITYDEIGNPLTYRDGMSMTWKNGRQLATLTNGDTSISYGYDSGSVRTTKTVNGVKYTYAYLNGQHMYETRGDAKFYYSYDANGILYNVRYTLTDGGTEYSYYYTHNSRGDIVGIYNGAGELKAHYEYDAWGNVISITDNNGNAITNPNHIGNLNPFRYRGYYQDTETGLYYLMSRYYDAIIHRFINADGYFQAGTSILDGNTFAYCGNNPVSRADTGGDSWFSDIVATVVESALTAMAAICPWMGSNSSTSVSHTSETKLINSDYAPVNFRCEGKTTTNISTHTYSLGSPTAYYNQDLYSYSDNYGNRNSGITHTFGIKSLSLDISMSFGSDGVGFSYAKINGDISMYISYKKCNNFVTETEVGFTKWDNSTGTTVYLGSSSNSVTSSMLMYAASSIPSIVGAGTVFKVLIPALGE